MALKLGKGHAMAIVNFAPLGDSHTQAFKCKELEKDASEQP